MFIHSIGLFTNIALKWHINSICRYSLESASTDSTIVQINSDLIFRPRLSCCQPIWSLLWLFLVFDYWLLLSWMVGSFNNRDIFLTNSPFTPIGRSQLVLSFVDRLWVYPSVGSLWACRIHYCQYGSSQGQTPSTNDTFSVYAWSVSDKRCSWLDVYYSDYPNRVGISLAIPSSLRKFFI